MFVVNDLLDKLLLGSFFFGLVFSALTLVLGVADIGIGHGGHNGSAGHDAGPSHGHNAAHDTLPILNLSTILAFLTWFGGVAYLARNGLGWFTVFSLGIGLMAGFVGAYIIYQALKKLRAAEGVLDPDDYRIEGTIARVTSSIRAGGNGEIVYKLGDAWQVSAARATAGVAIPRDTQVVITGRAGGFALVESWEAFLGDEHEDLIAVSGDLSYQRSPEEVDQRG